MCARVSVCARVGVRLSVGVRVSVRADAQYLAVAIVCFVFIGE